MTLASSHVATAREALGRRGLIGGSDARIIMDSDEGALLRLWREKRGEVEPEDLSGNLIVQLGLVTEALNRQWFERNSGRVITQVQRRGQPPGVRAAAGAAVGGVGRAGRALRRAAPPR